MYEPMNEKPEVYSLQKGEEGWQLSRRDFLKAAGATAVAVRLGCAIQPGFAADADSSCKTLSSHDSPILGIEFNPDSGSIVSIDGHGSVKLWSVPEGKLINDRAQFDPEPILFSSDGKVLYLNKTHSGDEGNLSIKHDFYKYDSATLFWKKNRRGIYSWEDTTKEVVISNLSADEEYIFICNEDNKIIRIPVANHDENSYLKEDGERSLSWKPEWLFCLRNGGLLAGSSECFTVIPFEAFSFTYHSDSVYTAAAGKPFLFHDQTHLLIQDKRTVNLYELTTGECIRTCQADSDIVDCLIFPGDLNIFVTTEDHSIKKISLPAFETVWEQKMDWSVENAAISPDGSLCVLKVRDSIFILSSEDGEKIREFDCIASDSGEALLRISPDGNVLAITQDNYLAFYSLPDGTFLGCPFDKKNIKETEKGIEVQEVNAVTGKVVTRQLPCGAAIPAGAVCTCNCVAGSVCSCVGYTTCSCDGHKSCSCNSHHTSYSYSYWYPN